MYGGVNLNLLTGLAFLFVQAMIGKDHRAIYLLEKAPRQEAFLFTVAWARRPIVSSYYSDQVCVAEGNGIRADPVGLCWAGRDDWKLVAFGSVCASGWCGLVIKSWLIAMGLPSIEMNLI
jgi:hypothetical protein